MSDVWHVQFSAKDFSAANQFLTRSLWKRLPHRWAVSVLGGTYSLIFTLGIFTLWKVVEERHVPYGRWFVGIFATAFVVGFVANSASRRIWASGMQQLWGANASPDIVRLDASAVTIEGGMGLTQLPWAIVQDIVREKQYLFLPYHGVACLYIPVAGFSTPAEFEAFEARARELFAKSRTSSGVAGNAG
ncbi:YcxB family protein [Ramlibacter sp. WS9]|uniref:YcxB family protein n=1 Tax=Ramlibacter sp. WS9 TaxID=1882741 RepID=UPI0011432179|nr:YcxB family protein [Ramlibacter sp. WS9]ROZ61529.1 YcxB family protein [Ramlibacter sp. WS9]